MSDDIKVYQRGESPQEKPYFEALLTALPEGWAVTEGPYCPGKEGHLTYKAVSAQGGQYRIAHVRDGDFAVTLEPAKIDHNWLAQQLGAEIVGKVEGPIHGMAGVANLTRQYQQRMKEKRDAADPEVDTGQGDLRGPDGGGPGGPTGRTGDGH